MKPVFFPTVFFPIDLGPERMEALNEMAAVKGISVDQLAQAAIARFLLERQAN